MPDRDGVILRGRGRISRQDAYKGIFLVKLLHEFGNFGPQFHSPDEVKRKAAELWLEASEHDVLFSDYTKGDYGAFLDVFLDRGGVWLEIEREMDHRVVGAVYLHKVIPKVDLTAHFTFWDSVGSGREGLLLDIMDWVFDKYEVHRISAELPVYQRGAIRLTKRLGLVEEGQRREAQLHKGDWVPLVQFGILRSEFEEVRENGRSGE